MVAAYQRSFNGLTFGDGTDYPIITETGLDGFTLRVGDREVPRGDGALPGLHLLEPKELFVELELASNTGTGVESLLSDVKAAFQPQRTDAYLPYVFEHGTATEFFVRARPTRIETRRDATTNWITSVPVALTCVDPFVYQGPSGGLSNTVQVTSSGVSNTETITDASVNARLPMHPQLVLGEFAGDSGELGSWTIENLTTGVTVNYDLAGASLDFGVTNSTWHMQAGDQNPFRDVGEDWVETADIVGSIGASSVPNWTAPRIPLTLLPGANDIRFTANGTFTQATLEVYHFRTL